MRRDVITGHEQTEDRATKFALEPHSKANQTYYDMLTTQKKPFHLRKGSLVTPERI